MWKLNVSSIKDYIYLMIEMFRWQKYASRSFFCWEFFPFSFFWQLTFNVHFFSIWTPVLNHDKYDEIKQFSKVDIKLNNISKVILLIKFLSMRSTPFARKSGCLHICLQNEVCFYLISNHNFVWINHKDTCKSDNKWWAQRIIEFTDEKLKPKVQIEDRFIYIMN